MQGFHQSENIYSVLLGYKINFFV